MLATQADRFRARIANRLETKYGREALSLIICRRLSRRAKRQKQLRSGGWGRDGVNHGIHVEREAGCWLRMFPGLRQITAATTKLAAQATREKTEADPGMIFKAAVLDRVYRYAQIRQCLLHQVNDGSQSFKLGCRVIGKRQVRELRHAAVRRSG